MTIGIDLGKSAPEDYFDYYKKAYTALEEEKIKDALDYVEKAKKIREGDMELKFIEAACLIKFKEFDKGMKIIRELLDVDPYHQGALYCRGKYYFEKKQFVKASEDLSKIKSFNSIFNEVPFYLGRCWLEVREFEKARECFLKALELAPEDSYVKSSLIKADEKLKKILTYKLMKNPFKSAVRKKLQIVKEELMKVKNSTYRHPSKLKTVGGVVAVLATFLAIAGIKLLFIFYLDLVADMNRPADQIKVSLHNPEIFTALRIDKEFEPGFELQIITKLPLKQTPYTTSDGFISYRFDAADAIQNNLKSTATYGDVYLCQYGSKKTVIVLCESDKPKAKYLNCKGYIRILDKKSLETIIATINKAGIDSSDLILKQYLDLNLSEVQLKKIELK